MKPHADFTKAIEFAIRRLEHLMQQESYHPLDFSDARSLAALVNNMTSVVAAPVAAPLVPIVATPVIAPIVKAPKMKKPRKFKKKASADSTSTSSVASAAPLAGLFSPKKQIAKDFYSKLSKETLEKHGCTFAMIEGKERRRSMRLQ